MGMKASDTSLPTVDVSVVVPVKNEVDSVFKLVDQVSDVLKKLGKSFEIVFVDDGSTDGTWEKIEGLYKSGMRALSPSSRQGGKVPAYRQAGRNSASVRGIRFRRNFGKSAALMAGFAAARGRIIITMDGDLQDDPTEIPHFLRKLDEGFDVVSGWKKTRHDPIHKIIPSRVMNWLAGQLTGAHVHDMNCGFKAYKRETALDLDLYGDLYRFIPAFAVSRGWKITEIPVKHHPRQFGASKYGFRRFITGWFDLLTVTFLTAYRSRPSHFFGVFGLALFATGSLVDLYLVWLRLATGSIHDRFPLLAFGTTLLLVGLQLILFGLLAELITAKRDRRSLYEVAEALE